MAYVYEVQRGDGWAQPVKGERWQSKAEAEAAARAHAKAKPGTVRWRVRPEVSATPSAPTAPTAPMADANTASTAIASRRSVPRNG